MIKLVSCIVIYFQYIYTEIVKGVANLKLLPLIRMYIDIYIINVKYILH